ncbi:MAG: hypothetical protein RLZZ612_2661, partial [Pseudomonadota bacterium]
LISILLGIFAVALYKAFGFDDGFAQGSGSLVQAIWGSAATIAAAFVAILLAMEAVQQSKQMNEFTKTQAKSNESYQQTMMIYQHNMNQLTSQQTPRARYRFGVEIARHELLFAIHQFDATFEVVIQKNLNFQMPAEKSALKLAAHNLRQELEEAKKTPLFEVLSTIPYFYIEKNDKRFDLKNFGHVLILLSVVVDHAFEGDPSSAHPQKFNERLLLSALSHLNCLALALETFVKDEKVISTIYDFDEQETFVDEESKVAFYEAKAHFKEEYQALIRKLSPDSDTEKFFNDFKLEKQKLRALPVLQELLSQRP